MKLHLFFLIYFTGLGAVAVYIRREVHHQYYLIMTATIWDDARSYCRQKYTDLATVVTDDDWVRLNKEAASKSLATSAWVGLHSHTDSWSWSLNELPLNSVTYRNWISGQPDNYGGKEFCILILSTGQWADTICASLRPFICYNANFSGSNKFINIASPYRTWPEAQTYCRTHHTDLASSLNSSDNDVLWQRRNLQGDSWIGLYRDGWIWSDGTSASNTKWVSGQPENYGGIENCAVGIGLFSDVDCNSQFYFFCHTILPVREQQIVRLQLKSDGSVLDPAVQSTVLEQIKQKMKDHNMLVNSTVTWRVQPNGTIFRKKNNL